MEYSIQTQKGFNTKQSNFVTGMTSAKKQKIDLNYPADSISFGNNEGVQKGNKGKFNWLKAGIISIIAIGIGILAYVLTKGKIGTKQVKQLAEHIDFKEAASVEEAMNFGKTHLGINEYKGFEKNDLEIINWINEGFVKVSNKLKGKAVMPEIVEYKAIETEGFLQSASANKRVYTVNKNIYGNIDKEIKEYLDMILSVDEKKHVTIAVTNCNQENLKNIVNQISAYYKGEINTFKKKVKLLNNLHEYTSSIDTKTLYEPVSEFSTNSHECGHLLDEYLRKHARNAVDKDMAELISYRAKENQAECLAEWFRKYMEGIKVAPEATEYVKKLGGIPVEELL